jgi:hypothetical protein
MNFRTWHESSTPNSTTPPLHRQLRETGIQGFRKQFCPTIQVKAAYLISFIIYAISPGEASKLYKIMLHSPILKLNSSIHRLFLLFNNPLGPLLILGFSGVICSSSSGNPSDDIFFFKCDSSYIAKISKHKIPVALRH